MTIAPNPRSLALLAALTTVATGFWALAAWALDEWHLVSLGLDFVPMAPPTALLFVVLGLAVAAQLRWPESRQAHTACQAGAGLTLLVGGIVLLQTWLGFNLPWAGWLMTAPEKVGSIPVGLMSPVTAGCFLFTAAALLGHGSHRAARPLHRRAAMAANGVVLAVASLVSLSYVTRTPLFYEAGIVPMALLTALAFLALNGSLFLSGLMDRLWEKWRVHDLADHVPDGGRDYTRRLILVGGALGGLIVLAGIFYLRRAQADARAVVYSQLDAIAQLKTGQIRDWRTERMGEARFLYHTSAVVQDIAAFAAQPGDPAARARVIDWLEPIKGGDRYEYLVVLDVQARPLLTIPAIAPVNPADCITPAMFAQAVASREPIFTDLRRDAGDPSPHLDLLVPIQPRAEAGGRKSPPVAVVVMRLDPRHFLFPLIRNWPLPSTSAETLLIRREGDEVVYLNEVRHQPDAAVSIRRPLRDPMLSAARAGRGEFGVHEGVDYRGIPVLSAIRPIPDSPWTLIAEVDQAEAFAAIQRDAWQTGVAVLLLLLAMGLAGTSLWRWRHANFLRRALNLERERKLLAQQLGLVMRHANDMMLMFDEQKRIVEANDRALVSYGYTAEEMRRLTVGELRAPAAAALAEAEFARAWQSKGVVFETVHRRRDGSTFPVEVSSRPFEIDGRRHLFSIIRDITERKAHELEIERLNRMYFVISQLNQSIVRARTQAGLFPQVCRVLVEFGGFRMAWVGWPNSAARRLVPVASAGDVHGYLRDLKVSLDPASPESRGPSGTAYRENRTCVCNDFFGDPALRPWHELARGSGFQSSIALPLRQDGALRGVLTVYAAEKDFFGPREIALLEGAAADLSFALEVIDGEARRQAAEAALRENEQKYRVLFESSRDVIMTLEPPSWKFTSGNPATLRMFRAKDEAEFLSLEPWRLSPERQPDGRPSQDKAREMIEQAVREGTCFFDWTHRRIDGEEFLAEVRLSRMERRGKVLLQATVRDVTERKQVEAALRESQALYHALVEQLPAGVFRKDPAGRYIFVSPWFCRLKGMKAEEFLGRTAQDVADSAAARRDPSGRAVKYAATGLDHHRQIMETGRTIELVEEYVMPGGRMQYINVIKSPVSDLDGKLIGTQGILFDITAGQQTEVALRESENLLQEAQQIAGLGSYDLDVPTGRWRSSAVLDRVFGIGPDYDRSVAGWIALIHPGDREMIDGYFRNEVLGRKKPFAKEYRIIRQADRAERWVWGTGRLDLDPQGRVVGMRGTIQDITERKQAELALRESGERFRALFEHSLDGFMLTVPDGRILAANPSACRILGRTEEQIRQEGRNAMIAPEDPRLVPLMEQRNRTGRAQGELTMVRGDGSRFEAEISSVVYSTASGPCTSLIIRDITERKRAELELQKLSRVVEQSPTSVVITDLNGAIEYVNPWFCRQTGYTLAEVRGQNPRILKSGDTPPEVYRDMWKTLLASRTWRGELHNRKKNGELFVELAVIAPVFGPDGCPSHFVAVKDDITERKRLEILTRKTLENFNTELEKQVAQRTEELAVRTRQMQALLNSIPDTVMRLRTDGTVLLSQPAHLGGAALAAITPPEGAPPAAAPPAALLAASLELGRQALAAGVTTVGETELATPGGMLALELRTAPTGADEFVVFARDITARKRLEEETAAMLEKERQVSEMKTRFIAVISHEFRTPMTAIAGSVELLANHLDRLSAEKRVEILERINRSQLRMTAMLDDVLMLNRMDANRTEVRLATVNLESFVQNIISEIRAADHDAHPFALHLPWPARPFVTDPNLLHHILANLLGNAVRYSPPGSVVTLSATSDAWRLYVSVEDHGIGIPPGDRVRIFEPFERGSNVSQIKGTGLGLNIVKRLTELLGGNVSLRHVAGGGTRFTLAFPLLPSPDSTP